MTLPGPVISQRPTPPARSAPLDAGRCFVPGLTERGPSTPVECHSIQNYKAAFGNRVTYGLLYDWLDTHFNEGGHTVFASRVLGPTPVKATANILDQSGSAVPGDVSMVITAKDAGDWGNALNFEITASGTDFTIIITHDTDGELERSDLLADRAAAVAWAAQSVWIDLALGASNEDPRAQGPTSLASGTDDRGSIADAQWLAALNVFTKDMGPGKVCFAGRTTTVGHSQLRDHAAACNRVARLDFPDSASAATLKAAALADRALAHPRYGGAFAPWLVIPGLTTGGLRTVPYSAGQTALEARSLAAGNSINEPAAGDNGQFVYAIGLSQVPWTEADREQLNDAGVNVALIKNRGVRTYGYRTQIDPEGPEQDWIGLNSADLYMEIAAKADAIAEHYMFRQLDGKGHVLADFRSDLEAMLMPYWTAGALDGDTFAEAARIDQSGNTPETRQQRKLLASIGLHMSGFAETVDIDISKVPVTQPV